MSVQNDSDIMHEYSEKNSMNRELVINLTFHFNEDDLKNGKFHCLVYLDNKIPYEILISKPKTLNFADK